MHDRKLSMSTQRYLILLHWSNSWLPMCTFRSVSVMCDIICLVISSITYDFDVLMTSLFDSYHSCTSVTHFWILVFSSTMLLPVQYISVSSAYRLQDPRCTCRLISLAYIRNKSGPKTDPCGTPIWSWHFPDNWFWHDTIYAWIMVYINAPE